MYSPEKMSSQMLPFSMMELTEQIRKQLCLQKGGVDSTRQKCWGWRKNPARGFCHWRQWVVKLQLIRTFCHPSGLGSSFLLLHLSSASCFPVAMLHAVCSRSPGWLSGGSKAMRSLSHGGSLCGQLIFKIHVKLFWNCTHHVTVNMQWMKSGPGETNFKHSLMEQCQGLS